jgi:hypothetical protein
MQMQKNPKLNQTEMYKELPLRVASVHYVSSQGGRVEHITPWKLVLSRGASRKLPVGW